MKDLIERLRDEDTSADDCFAAADAIERLTQERDDLREARSLLGKKEFHQARRALRAERERDEALAEAERLRRVIDAAAHLLPCRCGSLTHSPACGFYLMSILRPCGPSERGEKEK